MTIRWRMRVGRKLGRTLYLVRPGGGPDEDDIVIGMVDTKIYAQEIVRRWNEGVEREIAEMDERE